jgi:hypothetical protein
VATEAKTTTGNTEVVTEVATTATTTEVATEGATTRTEEATEEATTTSEGAEAATTRIGDTRNPRMMRLVNIKKVITRWKVKTSEAATEVATESTEVATVEAEVVTMMVRGDMTTMEMPSTETSKFSKD